MGRMSSLDKMWEEWGLLWKWALRTYFTTMGARSDSHFWSVCRVLLDKTGSWISDFSKVHGPSSVDRHCWILWTDRGRETACLWLTVGTEHQPSWGTPVLGLLRSCLDSAPVPLIGSLDLDWISLPAFFLGGGAPAVGDRLWDFSASTQAQTNSCTYVSISNLFFHFWRMLGSTFVYAILAGWYLFCLQQPPYSYDRTCRNGKPALAI